MNNDLISRQDAIYALEEQLDYLQKLDKNDNPIAEYMWYGVNWARNTIADLPPAERPQGEWIHHEEYTNDRPFYITECPFCKLRVKEETNFCQNCGAKMGSAE